MNHATAPTVDPQSGEQDHRAAWQAVTLLVLPAAVATLVVPGALSVLLGVGSAQYVAALVGITHTLIACVAAAAILRATPAMAGRHRLAWTMVGLGALAWGVANLGWVQGMARATSTASSPGWIPAFTVANTVLLVGAFLLPASPNRVAKIRLLDTAIMMAAATALLWVLPVNSLMSNVSGRDDSRLFTLLAAVKVLSVLVAMGTFVRCRPDERNEIKPLAFSLILLAVADLVFVSVDHSAYRFGDRFADALYTSALLLLLVAGRRLAAPPGLQPAATRSTRRYRSALPELATVVALVALAVHAQFDRGDLVVSLALAALLVLLAIVRLGQLEHEQRRLVASLQTSARRLFEQARLDSLTGLGNRLALDEQLARAVTRRQRGDGPRGIAVFFIDVDHFKRFNDGLGHHVGDHLLVEVAGRLRDVLGDDVHRVGGDEFVAVCDRMDLPTAHVRGRDVVTIVRAPIAVDGHELNCTVSVGLAHLSDDELGRLGADDLLRRADLALYNAKERGRNGLAVYDPRLQQRADARLGLQQGLHVAIERNQIEVHYRPVVDLVTGRVVGLGAEPRWRSDEHGLLGPDAFMQAMIDGGMLPDLRNVLFDDVTATLAEIGANRLGIDWVSTALSREEIVLPGLLDRVMDVLGGAGVGGERLRISVSEVTVLDTAALRVIHELRRLGVHLTVHRFGTGPSSLLNLGQYPANTICVDPSFVDGLGRRRDDTLIVTAVSGLTADLGLELAADGVSEEFQAQLLADLGCSLGTGTHFGEPVHRSDLALPPVGVR